MVDDVSHQAVGGQEASQKLLDGGPAVSTTAAANCCLPSGKWW
ncbi:hypothetical protein BZL29_3294 [Mycobacterium kansasii]|uniref:Uncharacterized protein n=1 Tax=Mycobacterium kansasii TaxID=1768 RepID=A0A1V3XF55_MYCKA|nr:hypothetical protein BZL29_3294 [Mycobacterium kansasii]